MRPVGWYDTVREVRCVASFRSPIAQTSLDGIPFHHGRFIHIHHNTETLNDQLGVDAMWL